MRLLVERGYKDNGLIRVTLWAPQQIEVERLREAYPELTEPYSDKGLEITIEDAKAWVGEWRYSWTVVAANKLRDGQFHA